MPIKGMTDKESIVPSFPRLGKLRKGGEKVNNTYGPDLDHFRFTGENGNQDVEAAFKEAFGNAPKIIHVYLPFRTAQENFSTWKELWKGSGLQHRCDGETMVTWLDEKGVYRNDPKPCPGKCEEVGRLTIIIPELFEAGFIGTVTMETHSIHDILHISRVLAKTEELCANRPEGMQSVLFTLRRVQEKVSTPGWGENKGQRKLTDKWLVKIEPAVDWVQANMALTRNTEEALPETKRAALPAPVSNDGMTVEEAMTITTKKGAVIWDMSKEEIDKLLDFFTSHNPKDKREEDMKASALMKSKTFMDEIPEGDFTEPE